ncbi:MAG: acyltransferase family protein [Anaerolineaceae bacterium]|nr:MAG: acyltransferase family protein [Anaerolineaceae bacterium]
MIDRPIDTDRGKTIPPTAETASSTRPRLFFIDNLRIVLITLVVLWHVAVTYGAPGTWPYQERQADDITTILFTLFYAANGPYVLGFFFLISGYFAPGSFERKGTWPFIRDWIRRLGIPLVLYILVFDPLIIYGIKSTIHGFQGSFWEYLGQHFRGYRTLGVGPMWFIEGLLIILIVYGLVRLLIKPMTDQPQITSEEPSTLSITIFAFTLGVVSFIVRIWFPVGWLLEPLGLPLALFPQFIAMFLVGIAAFRRNWFMGISKAKGKVWLRVAIFFIVVLFPIVFLFGGALEGDTSQFMGGIYWQSFAFAVWEQYVGVGMIIGLLVWFRERYNRQSALAKDMAANSFAVYFIHAPVLVFLALALRGIQLYPLLKFALVAPVVVALCFLIAHYLRRLPIVRSFI